MSLLDLSLSPSKFEGSVCSQIPDSQALFFPESGQASFSKTAKKICKDCPAKVPCGNFAIQDPTITHGTWGGMSIREIMRIRKTLGITEPPPYLRDTE